MGLIGRLLSFTRDGNISDVKLDSGGGVNITAEHFASPGDDSFPLPSDIVVTVEIPRGGGYATIGYIDPNNALITSVGEKRIYSRDASGTVKVSFWLKNDGSARLENDSGYLELKADGTVEANGAKILPNGDVITSDGISLRNHTHSQGNDSGGSAEQETNPPTL